MIDVERELDRIRLDEPARGLRGEVAPRIGDVEVERRACAAPWSRAALSSVTARRAASPVGPSQVAIALPFRRLVMIMRRGPYLIDSACARLRSRCRADDDFRARASPRSSCSRSSAAICAARATSTRSCGSGWSTAAGQLSRPDRYTRKALGKVLARQRVQARGATPIARCSIRPASAQLRSEPVFRTPLPKPDVDRARRAGARRRRRRRVGGGRGAARGRRDGRRRGSRPRACATCASATSTSCTYFYDQMCPACAELNWHKREQTADLRGRVVLVTGARVKIGYQAAVMLLRAGADVIVATRFPRDAARRFGREPDAIEWTRAAPHLRHRSAPHAERRAARAPPARDADAARRR